MVQVGRQLRDASAATGAQVAAERHRGEPKKAAACSRLWRVPLGWSAGRKLTRGKLILVGVEVVGKRGGASGCVVEENGGGIQGGGGILSEVVAELPGLCGAGEIAGDLGEGLAEASGGRR